MVQRWNLLDTTTHLIVKMAHCEPPISGHDEAGHAKAGRHAADLGADAGADQSAAGAFGWSCIFQPKNGGSFQGYTPK